MILFEHIYNYNYLQTMKARKIKESYKCQAGFPCLTKSDLNLNYIMKQFYK